MSLFERIPSILQIPAFAVLIFLIDIPWLTLVSDAFGTMVRNIQGSSLQLNAFAAAVVYIALGYLLTLPKSISEAFLLGLSTYAVFDFTNLSVFKDYELRLAVADSLWGGILMSIAFYIKTKL